MKCFKCGANCVTKYKSENRVIHNVVTSKIVEVNKACTVCDWESYPTKVPEPIK